MADVEKNLRIWRSWDWSRAGDEWSEWCGGTEAMWHGTLMPRIHRFLPAGTILEIAPGYGRWTQFLKEHCERLVLVDLAENCIAHCRERFAGEAHIAYHVNDGRSLAMLEDESVDLAFSFDSLVHAELDVLASYLDQLARKLKRDGVGFIHHSNLGAYSRLAELARKLPPRLLGPMIARGVVPDLAAWRAEGVDAKAFAAHCEAAGLPCIVQEKISWERGLYLIDSISTFTRHGSIHDGPPRVARNPLFGIAARRMARLYAGGAGLDVHALG